VSAPALDLSGFLASAERFVVRVAEPLCVRHEVTALQHALWHHGRAPILLVEQPCLGDGSPSPFRAVTNLTASREATAFALGLADHRRAAEALLARLAERREPVVVARDEAPVKQVVLRGEAARADRLPAFTQHAADPGPYLTAAHASTFDPDTGVDNTAIQRAWVRSPRELPWYPYPASHNRRNLTKFWERGEAAPLVFWIGHHPAVSIGAQAKLGYPESHWGAAGALAGAPVRLVASELYGEKLLVPADAEIVLEGHVPPQRLEPEGPFGEYTGYVGAATRSPVFVLECVTHREAAIYHDYGSGLPDALVPDNMLIEAELLRLSRQASPAVRNVHVPLSGRRFHAWLQSGPLGRGEARAVLQAALGYRRVKHVALFDEDVDVFDASQVAWALATRVQAERDLVVLKDLPGSLLDPSLDAGRTTTSKLGIDATWGERLRAPVNRVPEAAAASPAVARALAEALAR